MNEQNNKLEVMKNRCCTSAKVVGILRIFGIIGMIGSLVGAIMCLAQREVVNAQIAEQVASGTLKVDSLNLGGPNLSLVIDYATAFQEGDYAGPMIISCIVSVVICAAVTVLLTIFKKIFTDLSMEETPFSDSVMGRLKTSFIIMVVILALFVGIGPAVVGGLFMWCVYSILDYGKVLQIEVDETL